MFIVSLAWGAKYTACVPRFRRSLQKFDIAHRIVEMSGEPPRVMEARKLKPTIILDWLEKVGGPVSWVDVDSEVQSFPSELDGWKGDIRACKPEGSSRYWSGCISFNDTLKAIQTLERWQQLLSEREWTLDEEALREAIGDVSPDILALSPTYVWCEPWMRPIYPDLGPVILHGGISKEAGGPYDWKA